VTLLKTTNEEALNWVSYWYYVSTDHLLCFSDVRLKNTSRWPEHVKM